MPDLTSAGDSSFDHREATDSNRLFADAAYGPENLKAICRAFDRAWAAIAPIVDDTPLAREAARLKLANMILSVASNDKLDQARFKQPD